MNPFWDSCPILPQPHQSSGFTAQAEQGGRQWKTNGDGGFTRKCWIQGRQSKAEGDLQGQQQFTQQVAQGRQGFIGVGERCILWVLIRKRAAPSPDPVTWGGMWELMALQGASPLFWRSQTGHGGEPSLSQHGCVLQLLLLGHNSLRVIPACPCPTTALGQCSKGSLGGQCLQGGYKQTLRHLLLELEALPSSWQALQSLPTSSDPAHLLAEAAFLPCQGSSCCWDRAARLGTGSQVPPPCAGDSEPQGHQHRHTRVTSPTLQPHFPAGARDWGQPHR